MKKIIIGLTLIFALYDQSYAAGPYDGIYSVSVGGFFSNYASVHEVDNQIVVILVDPNPNATWEPMIGTRSGDVISLSHIPGVSPSDINLNVTVKFNNNGTSTATINSCTNGAAYVCKFPIGIKLDLVRIF